MNLKYYAYTLKLKEVFRLSMHSRSETPTVIVEIECDGDMGFGEASLPPYLNEDTQSVMRFFNKIDLSPFKDPLQIEQILDYVNTIDEKNFAAKAAIDIAIHDLVGKKLNLPLHRYLQIENKSPLFSSITIGISDLSTLKEKIERTKDYRFLKLKLGSDHDKSIVQTIRSFTHKPLYVDANQGWKDPVQALDFIHWLADQNVVVVEQPLPKEMIKDTKWLTDKSPIPIIADEAIQTIDDLELMKDYYSGVNIKLMKSGGIRGALDLIHRAKELNLKIMMGCMTETSCAIAAASHLAPLADWIDLDGSELISNDLFGGLDMTAGKIIISDSPGLGIYKN